MSSFLINFGILGIAKRGSIEWENERSLGEVTGTVFLKRYMTNLCGVTE